MMWLRFLGGILLVLAGFGGGQALAARACLRWQALCQLQQLLCRVLDAVRYQNLPGDQILARLQAQPDLNLFCLERYQHLDEIELPPQLPPAQREQFSPCLKSLGSVGGPQLCGMLERYRDLCAEAAHAAHEEWQQALRLYLPLGGCLGAMLVVLLL